MFKIEEKEEILTNFPNIKLSYENIIYKKVYNSDYIEIIPAGKKYFAWFTIWNENNVCLIMELTDNKQIKDIKMVAGCFSNELFYGTILYGTILNYNETLFFHIEDIHMFKGKINSYLSWGEKLISLKKMLHEDINSSAYNNLFIIFGLPNIFNNNKNNKDIDNYLKNIPYKVEKINYKLFKNINNFLCFHVEIKNNLVTNKKESNQIYVKNEFKNNVKNDVNKKIKDINRFKGVFIVKPNIQVDIYYLYTINEELKEEFHSIANIPDFNTSVMMNKLFRIIKENDNLDKLEESDDEEEFENENENKFVFLEKSFKMICHYNNKFKKWTPIKLADSQSVVFKNSELMDLQKIRNNKNLYE